MKALKFFESFVWTVLTVLLFYCLAVLIFRAIGFLENSTLKSLPLQVNNYVVVGGLFFSALTVAFFPLWNVRKYLKRKGIPAESKEIDPFWWEYISKFFVILVSYFALTCLILFKLSVGIMAFGSLLIILFLVLVTAIYFPPKFNFKKELKVINENG